MRKALVLLLVAHAFAFAQGNYKGHRATFAQVTATGSTSGASLRAGNRGDLPQFITILFEAGGTVSTCTVDVEFNNKDPEDSTAANWVVTDTTLDDFDCAPSGGNNAYLIIDKKIGENLRFNFSALSGTSPTIDLHVAGHYGGN